MKRETKFENYKNFQEANWFEIEVEYLKKRILM